MQDVEQKNCVRSMVALWIDVSLNFGRLLLQPRTAARARCAVLMFILSHSRKNEPRITRVSNSVLMGKLNCPLPKNFASKILPIEI